MSFTLDENDPFEAVVIAIAQSQLFALQRLLMNETFDPTNYVWCETHKKYVPRTCMEDAIRLDVAGPILGCKFKEMKELEPIVEGGE